MQCQRVVDSARAQASSSLPVSGSPAAATSASDSKTDGATPDNADAGEQEEKRRPEAHDDDADEHAASSVEFSQARSSQQPPERNTTLKLSAAVLSAFASAGLAPLPPSSAAVGKHSGSNAHLPLRSSYEQAFADHDGDDSRLPPLPDSAVTERLGSRTLADVHSASRRGKFASTQLLI